MPAIAQPCRSAALAIPQSYRNTEAVGESGAPASAQPLQPIPPAVGIAPDSPTAHGAPRPDSGEPFLLVRAARSTLQIRIGKRLETLGCGGRLVAPSTRPSTRA